MSNTFSNSPPISTSPENLDLLSRAVADTKENASRAILQLLNTPNAEIHGIKKGPLEMALRHLAAFESNLQQGISRE